MESIKLKKASIFQRVRAMFHAKQKVTSKRHTGDLGEQAAATFLMKHGFGLLERNYEKKWGEIDIVAIKDKTLHFVEVKTVSCDPHMDGASYDKLFLYASEHIGQNKIHRLHRTVQSYLADNGVPYEADWQLDAVFVALGASGKEAMIEMAENVPLT